MENVMKRLLGGALALILLAAVPVLPGCGSAGVNGDPAETKKQAAAEQGGAAAQAEETDTEEEEAFRDDVPEMKFDGAEFTFLTRTFDPNGYWGNIEFYAEELNGVAVNDAVIQRNRLTEDRFDIRIGEYGTGDVGAALRNAVASQEDSYDCLSLTIQSASSNAVQGNLLNFEDHLPYIDLSKPWWDPRLNNCFSLAHKHFYAVGDMTLIDKEATYLFMFNKDVAANHQIDDLYGLVREGGWTYDKMMELCDAVTSDADSDGKFTFRDSVGLVTDAGATFWAMYYAGGGTFFSKNAEDMPEYSIDMDRSTKVLEWIHRVRASDSVMLDETLSAQGVSNPWSDAGLNGMFKEGRALFYAISLTVMGKMRDMDSNFGVIPYPKLEETDGEYISYVGAELGNCVSVPVTAQNPDMNAAVLEAMCCESKNILMPAYYDVTVTMKNARDPETKEMLDYIFAHRTLDLAQCFDWGGLHSALKRIPSADQFASGIKRLQRSATRALEKTFESFHVE